jgi:hypothetical protein
MTVYYLCNNQNPLTGPENFTVQIYANDGGALVGDLGGNFNAPNTLLYTSPPIAVIPGDVSARVVLPSLAVPAKITFTLKFQGGLFDTGPFDPALAINIPGGRFWGSIPFANVQGPTGVMMRRVFTVAGTSAWGAQERPATFPATIPFTFAAEFMSGNTALITTPYDNGTNFIAQGGFLALGNPAGALAPLAAAGNMMSFDGPNRMVSQVDFGYYADTASSVGAPTFNFKLVKPNTSDIWSVFGGQGGTPNEAQVLWDSGPQPIPLGQGGGGQGALQNVTLPVPNVVVPENAYWIMTVTGLSGNADDIAGPGVIWGPIPGNTPNMFGGKDINGVWNQYVFGTGTGTFLFTTIAHLGPIKVTAGPATSTETLAPISEQIVLGNPGNGGNLASWAADDNNARRVCKFIVPNLQSPFVVVNLGFTTTKTTPTAITFETKAKQGSLGSMGIRLFVQNKVTNAYVNVLPTTALTLAYVVYSGNAAGTLTDYVGAGGAMTGRIEIQQTGPVVGFFPCADFEYANMKVTG